jgi:PAS domain-containing protein
VVFSEILQQGHSTVNENRLQARDGRMHLIEWHGSPVFLPMAASGSGRVGIDVTERHQAEEP